MPAETAFCDRYCQLFAALGRPLTSRDGIKESEITTVERKLGVRLPNSLRDYYLGAGKERLFNSAFNRLLPLKECTVESGKLVFMEENQGVVLWGVAATSRPLQDPAVFQTPIVDDEPTQWHHEHRRCSVFLTVMLHWQAVNSMAMRCGGSATVPAELVAVLDRNWSFAGEVGGIKAYSRPNQAVCLLKWVNCFGKEPKNEWQICAGAVTQGDLDAIVSDLGVQLKHQWPSRPKQP